MKPASSRYGAGPRTQANKFQDACLSIALSKPNVMLAMTADKLCDDKGISDRMMRREVEVRLLVAQQRERGRLSAQSSEGERP